MKNSKLNTFSKYLLIFFLSILVCFSALAVVASFLFSDPIPSALLFIFLLFLLVFIARKLSVHLLLVFVSLLLASLSLFSYDKLKDKIAENSRHRLHDSSLENKSNIVFLSGGLIEPKLKPTTYNLDGVPTLFFILPFKVTEKVYSGELLNIFYDIEINNGSSSDWISPRQLGFYVLGLSGHTKQDFVTFKFCADMIEWMRQTRSECNDYDSHNLSNRKYPWIFKLGEYEDMKQHHKIWGRLLEQEVTYYWVGYLWDVSGDSQADYKPSLRYSQSPDIEVRTEW